jgi:hypothetical protein
MNQRQTILLFICSMLVVGGASFYVGNSLVGTPLRSEHATPTSIVDEAKRRVPPPKIPQAPSGHEVPDTQLVTREVQVPHITMEFRRVGPIRIQVPVTTIQTQTLTQQVPVTKLVGATPEEKAEWQSSVDKITRDYNEKLDAEIKHISRDESLEIAKRTADYIKGMLTDVITPLVIACAGLAGAIISLMRALGLNPRTRSLSVRSVRKAASRGGRDVANPGGTQSAPLSDNLDDPDTASG